MKKPTLLVLKGLPASGKTTFATKLCQEDHNYVRSNKDELRAQHGNLKEKEIIELQDAIINTSLRLGYSVVVDDTNLNPFHEKRLRELAVTRAYFTIEDKFLMVPLETCIERDSKRANPVGKQVIQGMYDEYIKPKLVVPYVPINGKPRVFLCDIDGTIAINDGHRHFYDYTKVSQDKPNVPIMRILYRLLEADEFPIFISGREDSCRDDTLDWLITNLGIREFELELYMRKTGDHRPDHVIKRELFDKHIRDHYNVQFVLDDRDQVVKMWRKLGLTCLQVAEGNF